MSTGLVATKTASAARKARMLDFRKLAKMKRVALEEYFEWLKIDSSGYEAVYVAWMNRFPKNTDFKRSDMPRIASDRWVSGFICKMVECGVVRKSRHKSTIYRINSGWVYKNFDQDRFFKPYALCVLKPDEEGLREDVFQAGGGELIFGRYHVPPTEQEWRVYADSIGWEAQARELAEAKASKRKARLLERLAFFAYKTVAGELARRQVEPELARKILNRYAAIDRDKSIVGKPPIRSRLAHIARLASDPRNVRRMRPIT